MLSKWNCRQCGGKLELLEFGPEKICPHCGKETAPVHIKEVHINFSDTIYGDPAVLPRDAAHRFVVGVDYLNVCFRLELSMGDISNPPESNSFAYAHRYGSYESMELIVEKHIRKLSQATNDTPVYLWINERDVNAYLNLLKFSNLFKRFDNVYLIRCCSEKDMENDEYEPNDSFSKKVSVSKEELDSMTIEYNRILELGGEFRIGAYGDVHVCSEEYLEKFVREQITEKYVNFNSIYSKVHDAFKEATGYVIHYNVVEELVWRMMTARKIQSHGACEWWGDSSYNNMLCTQSFHIGSPKKETYTYSDALKIVYDAFAYGYTCPLYEIIAPNAILSIEDSNQLFEGRSNVINYIENDGSARVHVKKQKVSCDILRIAEGERYGIGDLCILLSYECEDETINHYIIKVRFENEHIQEIKIFTAKGPLRLIADEA